MASVALSPALISIACNLIRIPLANGLAAGGLGVEGVWWAISLSSMLKGVVIYVWYKFLIFAAKV